MSYLVQVLLPLQDDDGRPQPLSLFRGLEMELTTVFSGVTAYIQSSARDRWVDNGGNVSKDEIVLIEVSTEEIDANWWATLRERLTADFRQEAIVIRAGRCRRATKQRILLDLSTVIAAAEECPMQVVAEVVVRGVCPGPSSLLVRDEAGQIFKRISFLEAEELAHLPSRTHR